MNILITGSAGFIGSELIKKFLDEDKNCKIIGVDNLNNYYDVNLKKKRLNFLKKNKRFKQYTFNLNNKKKLFNLGKKFKFDFIIHLAAQAGVRYSITNPDAYIDSNIISFYNILEFSRQNKINQVFFASSSSVYGLNKEFPYSEKQNTDKPVSLYAATKKSNEIMAYAYSDLYKINFTGLRFFTVYGPWGRPDMAYFSFAKKIIEGKRIEIFNHGNLSRDFTFIDDIIEMTYKLIRKIEKKKKRKFEIYNLGNTKSEKLNKFISLLEKHLKIKAKKKYVSFSKGDVKKTHANISKLNKLIRYKPKTNLDEGLFKFVNWYKDFYHNK